MFLVSGFRVKGLSLGVKGDPAYLPGIGVYR